MGQATASDATGVSARACAAPAHAGGWQPALRTERILQAVLAIVCAGALVLGMILVPSPDGVGTHEALGLPPCGMWVVTHHPCPTCGVTTSFALAAHGRLIDSFVNQPFGLLVFLMTVAGLAVNGVGAAMGRSWFGMVTVRRAGVTLIVTVAILLVSWAYKWSIM